MGSDLDEPTLQQIAAMTGGEYFRARDLQALQAIYRQLDQLEPQARDTLFYRDIHEWYTWPLGAALLLSALLGLVLSGRMAVLVPRRKTAANVVQDTQEAQHG
jgi:Ca-activated chloride channel family protein